MHRLLGKVNQVEIDRVEMVNQVEMVDKVEIDRVEMVDRVEMRNWINLVDKDSRGLVNPGDTGQGEVEEGRVDRSSKREPCLAKLVRLSTANYPLVKRL